MGTLTEYLCHVMCLECIDGEPSFVKNYIKAYFLLNNSTCITLKQMKKEVREG